MFGWNYLRCSSVCAQDVSINKYFDDSMLLELARHEADKEMEMME